MDAIDISNELRKFIKNKKYDYRNYKMKITSNKQDFIYIGFTKTDKKLEDLQFKQVRLEFENEMYWNFF